MNKQSAIEQAIILQQQMEEMQEQLNQLQEQAVRLQQIINAPEKKSLLQAPDVESNNKYFILTIGANDCFKTIQRIARSRVEQFYNHGNLFQSEQLAQDYAKAINTMLLLRHQEGAVAAENYCRQWIIFVDKEYSVCTDFYDFAASKIHKISPCFESKEAAQKAIANVGEENIIHMFKTFHHVED